MALKIGTLIKAQDERRKREAIQDRAKFLYYEYIGFSNIKEFAEYFEMSVREAIDEITLGRRLAVAGE